jgi:hypothetical protein
MLMDSFEIFFERVKNPLRKARLQNAMPLDNMAVYKRRLSEIENDPKFKDYKKNFPERAAKHLENQKEILKDEAHIKPSLTPDKYEKVRLAGFDVYFDKELNFMNNPVEFYMFKRMAWSTIYTAVHSYLKGIVPIVKPKIVISDLTSEEETAYRRNDSVPAYYQSGVLYLDEYQIHSVYKFVHEYAHYLTDRISSRTEPILQKAYNDMLDSYYKEANKKKMNLADKRTHTDKTSNRKLKERQEIAKKLGFPSQYAFNNFHEFFAELIANWKTMPTNPITYRFKKAVRSVLNTL